MSNLIEHAKNELRLLGYTGEEPEGDMDRLMYDHIIEMVETFSKVGHSGSSGQYAIHVLTKILKFENLTPLTSNPDEWVHVAEDMWQNKRNSEAFSHDGGITYSLLSETEKNGEQIFHRASPAR